MYKVKFSKALYRDVEKSDLLEVVEKDLELPFPPYLGLEVHDGRFRSGKIESVTWLNDENYFSALTPDKTPLNVGTFDEVGIDFVLESLCKREGWKIVE